MYLTKKHEKLSWLGVLLVVLPSVLVPNLYAMTCVEMEALAQKQSPVFNIARESLSIATFDYYNASSQRLPSLFLIGSALQFEDEDGFEYLNLLGSRLTWPIYQGGRIINSVHVADERKTQTELSLRIANITLRREIREAFARAIYAKNLVGLASKIKDRRQKNLDFIRVRYRGGLEFKWVLESEEAKLQNSLLRILEAELAEKSVLSEIESVVGVAPIKSLQEIDEAGFYQDTVDYNLNDILTIIENHPVNIGSVSELMESRYLLKISKGFRLPEVSVQADILAANSDSQAFFPFWSLGVRLTMPLFEGNRNLRNIEIARLRHSNEELDLNNVKLRLKSQITMAYQSYVLARKRLDVSALNYNANNNRANVVNQQYSSGLTNFLNWERAMDDWEAAEDGLLQARRDYQIARSRFEEAIGKVIDPT